MASFPKYKYDHCNRDQYDDDSKNTQHVRFVELQENEIDDTPTDASLIMNSDGAHHSELPSVESSASTRVLVEDSQFGGDDDDELGVGVSLYPETPINPLTFGLEEAPPWYTCILLGFQHYMMMFGTTIPIPFLLATGLCIESRLEIVNHLISTIFLTVGIATLLQVTIGARLPLVQGAAIAYATTSLAILNQDKFKCQPGEDELPFCNGTPPDSNLSQCTDPEKWKLALNELNGAIIITSAIQMVCGLTGLIGYLLKIIGPLTIAPTVAMIGFSLFEPAASYASKHWWIAMLTTALLLCFALYMRNVGIPSFSCGKESGCYRKASSFPLFQMFPVILGLMVAIVLCGILTATDVLPNDKSAWGYAARTDARVQVLYESSWFLAPYPGQWGLPIISISSIIGILGAVFAGVMKAVGDYNTVSKVAMVSSPPMHAVNRGIVMEGLGNMLSGCLGAAVGTTTYSINVGAVGITRVASRRVIQIMGLISILLAFVGKIGAVFVAIPVPVIGGLFFFLSGIIAAFGLSNLQYVDMNSPRNLIIVGFSFFFALSLPQWILKHGDHITTGVDVLDSLFRILLGSGMFVGGLVACILDNTVSGTKEERGLGIWNLGMDTAEEVNSTPNTYDLPLGMTFIRKWRWTSFVPICPTFRGFQCRPSDNRPPTEDHVEVTTL